MTLTNSNTYIEPTAGTALNTARLQQNDTFRSILSNFYSTSAPAAINLTASGAGLDTPNGTLFRSATTGALYIADSVNKKSSPVGGNFTRIGIGNRVEPNLTALTANKTTYEIGELVGTIDTGRLYFRTSNTDSIGSFIDVGAPQGYTVGTLNNVAFSGQSITGITFLATANVGINTASPLAEFHVTGNAIIASNSFIRIPFGNTIQRPATAVTGMLRYNTTNTTLEVYSGTAWAGTLNITDDTTSNATRYIAFTGSNSGSVSNATVSSTKLTFNPSTGTVTATEYVGSAANLTSFPVATQIQAEAGTDNTQLMTPLRTKQAIDSQPRIHAWGVIDPDGNTVVSSTGVTSSRNADGDYYVNFPTANSTNYAVLVTPLDVDIGSFGHFMTAYRDTATRARIFAYFPNIGGNIGGVKQDRTFNFSIVTGG